MLIVIGDTVVIEGKIKEIIQDGKGFTYRVKIHELGREVNSFLDEVLVIEKDIKEIL